MGKSTISMAIFNSYFDVYQRVFSLFFGMILVYAPQQKAWFMGWFPFWDGWPYPIASGNDEQFANWKITIVNG